MNPLYADFENSLKEVFLVLRPTFTATGQEPIEEIVLNPIYKKLIIIDRTLLVPEVFEAGYLLWEEVGRDIEKFFNLFELKVIDGQMRLEIIDKDGEDDKTE